MENLTVEHIIPFVQDHRFIGYMFLFFAMVLEGETFLLIAGILASLKAFDVGDVLWISFVGVVLGNIMWYKLGEIIKDKEYAKGMIKWSEKAIMYFLPRFREKPFKSIFFSKFIYGVNRATVIMSGVLRVPFKLFFKAELLASILWVMLYLSIGYFFGQVAVSMTRNASRLALIVVVFVVGFVLLQRFLSKRYGEHEHEHEKKDHNA